MEPTSWIRITPSVNFQNTIFTNGGASLVHQESDQIIFGPGRQHLLEFCIYSRYNIVVPLVGRTDESMKDICES